MTMFMTRSAARVAGGARLRAQPTFAAVLPRTPRFAGSKRPPRPFFFTLPGPMEAAARLTSPIAARFRPRGATNAKTRCRTAHRRFGAAASLRSIVQVSTLNASPQRWLACASSRCCCLPPHLVSAPCPSLLRQAAKDDAAPLTDAGTRALLEWARGKGLKTSKVAPGSFGVRLAASPSPPEAPLSGPSLRLPPRSLHTDLFQPRNHLPTTRPFPPPPVAPAVRRLPPTILLRRPRPPFPPLQPPVPPPQGLRGMLATDDVADGDVVAEVPYAAALEVVTSLRPCPFPEARCRPRSPRPAATATLAQSPRRRSANHRGNAPKKPHERPRNAVGRPQVLGRSPLLGQDGPRAPQGKGPRGAHPTPRRSRHRSRAVAPAPPAARPPVAPAPAPAPRSAAPVRPFRGHLLPRKG